MEEFDRSKNLVVAPQTHKTVIKHNNTQHRNPTPQHHPLPLIHPLPFYPYPTPSTYISISKLTLPIKNSHPFNTPKPLIYLDFFDCVFNFSTPNRGTPQNSKNLVPKKWHNKIYYILITHFFGTNRKIKNRKEKN